jgi:hypothetical protein
MFRTEVVESKNLRKTVFFKIYNGISILLLILIIVIISKVFPPESTIGKFIAENYTSIIQPVVMGVAFLLIIMSVYTRNSSKNPKRIGSLELDTNEARFLINDELQETIKVDDVDSVDFVFYQNERQSDGMHELSDI